MKSTACRGRARFLWKFSVTPVFQRSARRKSSADMAFFCPDQVYNSIEAFFGISVTGRWPPCPFGADEVELG